MPSNPRQAIRRDLDTAMGQCDRIQVILMRNADKYAEHHPEIVAQYKVAFEYTEQLKALIDGLSTEY